MAPAPKALDRKSRLQDFIDWAKAHISGDEKGEALIFLDRFFHAFGQMDLLNASGTAFAVCELSILVLHR